MTETTSDDALDKPIGPPSGYDVFFRYTAVSGEDLYGWDAQGSYYKNPKPFAEALQDAVAHRDAVVAASKADRAKLLIAAYIENSEKAAEIDRVAKSVLSAWLKGIDDRTVEAFAGVEEGLVSILLFVIRFTIARLDAQEVAVAPEPAIPLFLSGLQVSPPAAWSHALATLAQHGLVTDVERAAEVLSVPPPRGQTAEGPAPPWRAFDINLTCSGGCGLVPHRWRPSPEAGLYWRCSECGDVFGPVVTRPEERGDR